MSVTRLKRKHRKNIARANNKQHIIKNLLRTPVLKNVDLDELKARFTAPTAGAAPAAKADSLVDKAKHAVSDAVSHSEVLDKAKHAVGVEVTEPKPEAQPADKTAENAEGFDDAEAVTKPVNEDGQEGEHPKPEIAL